MDHKLHTSCHVVEALTNQARCIAVGINRNGPDFAYHNIPNGSIVNDQKKIPSGGGVDFMIVNGRGCINHRVMKMFRWKMCVRAIYRKKIFYTEFTTHQTAINYIESVALLCARALQFIIFASVGISYLGTKIIFRINCQAEKLSSWSGTFVKFQMKNKWTRQLRMTIFVFCFEKGPFISWENNDKGFAGKISVWMRYTLDKSKYYLIFECLARTSRLHMPRIVSSRYSKSTNKIRLGCSGIYQSLD